MATKNGQSMQHWAHWVQATERRRPTQMFGLSQIEYANMPYVSLKKLPLDMFV